MLKEIKDEIFVTYAWGTEAHPQKGHQEQVIGLTEHLRLNGFNAEMDIFKSQEETSISFTKMMHSGIATANKVVIVLSEAYKEKAETFIGGVGEEYNIVTRCAIKKPTHV